MSFFIFLISMDRIVSLQEDKMNSFFRLQRKSSQNLIRFTTVYDDITDKSSLAKNKIDAVVNAARPTLMGSRDPGVDRSVHEKVDEELRESGEEAAFNDKIREELDGDRKKPEMTIRCQRGRAVLTKGYNLCGYIIHVVGTKYLMKETNGRKAWEGFCPSSSVQGLESCYYEIVNILKQYPDIRNIAVPVVGSGNYGFPREYALRIATASLFNAVLEWYKKDPEIFLEENSGHRGNAPFINVYFYIYDKPDISEEETRNIEKILSMYNRCFDRYKRVVFQNSAVTHFQYLSEIVRFDRDRGYFAVVRAFRFLLLLFRTVFLPVQMIFKDWCGGHNWERRRMMMEILSVLKAVSGISFWYVSAGHEPGCLQFFLMGVSVYFLADTVTYLLALIVLGDIESPGANIIRSLFLLLVNYIEVSFDLAFIYYTFRRIWSEGIRFYQSAAFAFFGIQEGALTGGDQMFLYAQQALGFLFISFAFAYFLNHVQPRRFL